MKRPDWFLLGIFGAAALAWFFPQPGAKGGSLHPALANKLGVALIFFLHGLVLPLGALAAGTRKWRLHLLVQLCTFGLFPLLGLALHVGLTGHVQAELVIGLFFLCALPSTVSSSVALTATARGDVPAAVFNATLSSLAGVFLTPLWLGLVLELSGQTLPLGRVVRDLLLWLVLPLFVGQAFRPLLGAWATKHKPKLGVIDRLTILLLVYTSFCDSFQSGVWSSAGSAVVVTTLVACALLGAAMAFTWWAARTMGLPLPERIAALFCGSKKTLASGVPMARLIFGAHPSLGLILLPIMVYHPIQLIVGGWLAGRFARAPADEAR